jgi:uncharacterized protein YjiS (DUF1127 family)
MRISKLLLKKFRLRSHATILNLSTNGRETSSFELLTEFRSFHMSAIPLQELHGPIAGLRQRSVRHRVGDAADRGFAVFREWRRRSRDRARLAALDDRMLRDIGITRADVEYLSNKPFWRE